MPLFLVSEVLQKKLLPERPNPKLENCIIPPELRQFHFSVGYPKAEMYIFQVVFLQ